MYTLRCEHCKKGNLILDEQLSKEFMWDNYKIMYTEIGELIEDNLSSSLVYRCLNCEKIISLTYKEWEKQARKQMMLEVLELKRRIAFRTAPGKSVDADNGFVFCGYCPGYDSVGNCFKSVFDKCQIRKDKLKINELQLSKIRQKNK